MKTACSGLLRVAGYCVFMFVAVLSIDAINSVNAKSESDPLILESLVSNSRLLDLSNVR